jgi:hypothetical protein
MKITFRVYGPEIKKAVVDWTRKHLVAAADLQAFDIANRPGAPYGNAWTLDDETYIDVAFTSESDPGADATVRVKGPEIQLAVVAWSQTHLLMARDLVAEPVLRRITSSGPFWSLIDEDDYVYINLEFESEKP